MMYFMDYDLTMFEIRQTKTFQRWASRLKDQQAARQLASRLVLLKHGHLGDVEPVSEGIHELRIHCGAGYRVYFQQQGQHIILLLCGGDKDSQRRDIKTAKQLCSTLGP